jgi:hypothetical protein
MTNKVRRDSHIPTSADTPVGPALYLVSRGTARIEDRSTSWPSRRYLASLVLDWDGWILTPRLGDGSHGPFSSAEAAFAWWADHHAAMPASTWRPWVQRQESWPPGIDEDRAEQWGL